MNDATLPTTSYVSRVLALPPGVARQVFDLGRVDRQHRSPDPDRWTVATGDHVLRVDGPGHVPQGSTLLRSCPGSLRTGRFSAGVAVELELTAWSATRTEVALRLVRRRRARPGYLDAATACVDALASELELRGLLALHPAHGTGAEREVAGSAWL